MYTESVLVNRARERDTVTRDPLSSDLSRIPRDRQSAYVHQAVSHTHTEDHTQLGK